ncbi:MAG: hypothetical protein ACYTFW_24815, partial [Planctomycetota bacterium]
DRLGFQDEKGRVHGWHAGDPQKKRRWVLNRLVEQKGYRKVISQLNALINVTTYDHVKSAARADMNYLQRRRDKQRQK